MEHLIIHTNGSGPLGFFDKYSTINLTLNGNYYVTVTDSYGCKTTVSGFIHQRFEPVIVNLGNGICEGQSINLSVNATNAVHYQWGSMLQTALLRRSQYFLCLLRHPIL
ncbi:MAG: hypothetical protein IPL20_13410 [Saprospiraceae bacterium]|nr:hypothetical protein [Saprospiraceae bacterium]